MKNTKLRTSTAARFVAAAATLAGLLGVSTSADAAFVSYICDDALCVGGGDTIVTDQGVGDNFPGSSTTGQINSGALSIGGFTIVSNISKSKPLIGSAAFPQLDLGYVATTSDNATHTVYLYATDTGFSSGGLATLTMGGTQPASGNSIEGSIWGGNSNTNLDLSNLIASASSFGTSPFALSSTGGLNATGPFSLAIGVKITRSGAGTTAGSLNGDIAPVPLPAAAWLLCSGLAGLGAMARRRRARSSNA